MKRMQKLAYALINAGTILITLAIVTQDTCFLISEQAEKVCGSFYPFFGIYGMVLLTTWLYILIDKELNAAKKGKEVTDK